ASWPHYFSFMAKSELFKNPLLRWLLVKVGAFPVDRAHPGPSAIKVPVRALKQENKALMIFPTGSRYSADMKGGAILIAKLAKAPIVPAVYQGPGTFWSLFKRKPAIVRFGSPVEPPKGRLTDEALATFSDQLQEKFAALDHAINPDYKYIPD
ncbi:MAG TPA: 1-acyl-sn-glycerol-3-phosphate acyltransferase, partial [Lactobacillus sp.]|nr:1-acyl-sn-glycerol-3-phosphate acyltransferase [Lactobacillus sp.]